MACSFSSRVRRVASVGCAVKTGSNNRRCSRSRTSGGPSPPAARRRTVSSSVPSWGARPRAQVSRPRRMRLIRSARFTNPKYVAKCARTSPASRGLRAPDERLELSLPPRARPRRRRMAATRALSTSGTARRRPAPGSPPPRGHRGCGRRPAGRCLFSAKEISRGGLRGEHLQPTSTLPNGRRSPARLGPFSFKTRANISRAMATPSGERRLLPRFLGLPHALQVSFGTRRPVPRSPGTRHCAGSTSGHTPATNRDAELLHALQEGLELAWIEHRLRHGP